MPYDPVTRGYVAGPGEGVSHGDPELKASGRSTGGSLTLYELIVDGEGPPRHTHSREDETLYVLTGYMEVECGDDRFEAAAGSLAFLPRNVPHAFRSVGGPARVLLIVTPGGLDEFFAARDAAMAAGAGRAEIMRIITRHGF